MPTPRPDFSAIALVVYDLDGTVVNAFGDIAAAANHALRQMGRATLTVDEVTQHVGHGVVRLMQDCLGGDASPELVEEAVGHFKAYAAEHPADHTYIYEGVEDLMAALHVAGVRQAIVSNKPHELTVRVVQSVGLDRFCEEVAGERPAFPRKPDPALLLHVMKSLGVEPSRALMVGDGDTDMQAGRAAGMATCGVTWGKHTGEQLRGWGADDVVDTPAELLGLMGRGGNRKI